MVVFGWIKLYHSGSIRMGGLCDVWMNVRMACGVEVWGMRVYMALGSGRQC